MPHSNIDLGGLNTGLNLSARGNGSLTLGQNQPVNPSQVNPIAAPLPQPVAAQAAQAAQLPENVLDFQNAPFRSGALALGEIAATIGGFDRPLTRARADLAQQKQSQLQQKQLQRQNTVQAISLGVDLAKSAATMKGEQKANFIKRGKESLAALGDAEAIALFESIADSPDRADVIVSGVMENSEIVKQLKAQDPSGASVSKFLATTAGAEEMDRMVDQFTKPLAMQKISGLTSQLDKLARDGNIDKVLLKRVQADGKISVPEIRELVDSMPEGHDLKLSPQELSAATADRNLDSLRAVGISLSEEFKPEEVSGSGKTVVDAEGKVVGTLVTSKTGGNQVQPPGGGAPRPFTEGEFVTTISDTAEGAGLAKKTRGKLEDTIISTTGTIDAITSQLTDFDKAFLTFGGRLKFEALELIEKTGVELSPENAAFTEKFTSFKAQSISTLSEELRRLSGAAASDKEVKNRLEPVMPNIKDSPTVYLSKARTVIERLQVIKIRAGMALEQGLEKAFNIPWQTVVNQIENGSLPQARLDSLIEEGLSEQEAFIKVKSEFPTSMLQKAMSRGQ